MNQRKKLLFVINTMGQGGAEHALLELLRALCSADEGFEVSLYVLMGQGELIDQIPSEIKLLNKKYCKKSVLSSQGKRSMYGHILKSLCIRGNGIRLLPEILKNYKAMKKKGHVWPDKLLWRAVADGGRRLSEEYDLAVAFLEGGAAYYVTDHVKAKKKAAFIHIDYQEAGYTRELDRDCYLKFDAVFPIAEEIRDRFLAVYPECKAKTKIFHNMLNRAEIIKKSLEPGGFTDDFTGLRILTVGRLVYQKAYPLAIEAMKLLKEAGHSVRWYVLGEGDMRQELEEQIAALGLTQDFILLGVVENPYPYYRMADLYVHATRFEGKSIAIQEAQILGKAVVVSDCPGNREQIQDGVDGLLCDLTAESIKVKTERLIKDTALREQFEKNVGERQFSYEKEWELLMGLLTDEKE